ncbi:MAG TPA: ABC transporter permease subunit [Acetobacteraceae bacterium]|nr:ABC transporter permease subunit [Acetobacteraceae bacterium]
MGVLVLAGVVMIFLPLVLTLYLSFFDEKLIIFPPRGYTLHWYLAAIPHFGGALITSLEVAAIAVSLSLLIGVPAGIAIARRRFRGRGVVSTLLLAPLTVPGIALGLAIYVLAVAVEERTGAALAGSFVVLAGAHLLITIPWVVRLCVASLVNQDEAAEEAAASLGARPLVVLWRITLPSMRQGILAATLFAFIISFGELEMTLFLVGPGMTTLPIAVLEYLKYHIDPLISAMAVLQMLVIGVALTLLDRYVRLGGIVR